MHRSHYGRRLEARSACDEAKKEEKGRSAGVLFDDALAAHQNLCSRIRRRLARLLLELLLLVLRA